MRVLATIAGCLFVLATGCETQNEADLLEVSAVEPAHLAPGQALRIRGSGFPPGRSAIVRLEGTMHRAGAEPSAVAVELGGRAVASDRIEARFTRSALRELGGRGTLHGRAVALFEAADGRGRVIGRSAPIELDISTGATESQESELARQRAGMEIIERLGLLLAEENAVEAEGLAIAGVRDGSVAEHAGLLTGDRLLAVERVHVQDLADVMPAPGRDTITLRLARSGEAAPFDVVLAIEAPTTNAVRSETVRSTSIALAWVLLFAVLFAPSAGLADWIAGARRREPRTPWTMRVLWRRHRRAIPMAALGAMSLVALPALDRLWPVHAKLEMLVLGALALRAAIAWLGTTGASGRARVAAIGGALASVLAITVGLGAIATVGGTTDLGALAAQPSAPWDWTWLRWPIAVPAIGLISLGGAWRTHGGSPMAQAVDDVVLLAVAAATVAVTFGGWGSDEAQGPLRLVRGVTFVVLAFGYWAWLRRMRTARPARPTVMVGGALGALVILGTIALIALEPPDVLTAAIARVLGGAAVLLLLSAAARAAAEPRPRAMPLHRFA